jgi:alkanesulfonate monooxygenase SsuD/methylene tetrahydromethanopterin reductase-like flavin-dependent oxidoreductase (luciferase family)
VRPWFGLYLPQIRMGFDTILERTLAAEEAGFDSVWLMDHLAAPMAPQLDVLEGWTLAAALAARTTTIRLGHLTTCDPFRHPAVLAKMVATVDAVSGGRLDLGIGWGSVADELRTYGVGAGPAAARAGRLRESLAILRGMLAGDPFDHAGEHFRLEGAIGRPVPVQERVPIHVGGGGPALTMPIVRDFADWWNCPLYAYDRLDDLRPLAGDARVSLQRVVALVEHAGDADEALAVAQRRFGGWGPVLCGTAEAVAEALARDVARGIEGFVVQTHDFGSPATVARFMAEVAPAVRAAVPGAVG